jgi:hypothetical protein
VQFRLGTSVYIDREGLIFRDIQPNGSGTLSGSMDYSTSIVTLDDWTPGSADFELLSLLTTRGQHEESEFHFYTDQAPVQPTSLIISAVAVDDGELLTASSTADGEIEGDYAEGTHDSETGLSFVRFGAWVNDADLTDDDKAQPWYDADNVREDGRIWRPRPVIPSTVKYGCVVLTSVPVDPEILGLSTVRLPPNGRVPMFRPGDFVMLMHTAETTGTPALDNDSGKYVLDLGRERVSWVRVTDAAGEAVTDGYTLERAAGLLKFDAIAGLATPLTVRHTISDLVVAREVRLPGYLAVNLPLTHTYPAGETLVASCLPLGDRRARVSAYWDQKTWDQSWKDYPVGEESLGNLNLVAHPIQVTNLGCITERWAVVWQTNGNVNVYGEEVGLVYSGAFTSDIAPLNPHALDHNGQAVPYFVLPAAANGGGFTGGNVFRFNTVAAQCGFWIAGALQQSPIPLDDAIDGCELRLVCNVNNPVGE